MQTLWTLLGVGSVVMVTVLPGAAEPVTNDAVEGVAQPPGALSITVPAAVNLGTAFPGSSISRQLGQVRVADTRGRRPATWTATVAASDFTTPGGGAARQISRSQVSYWSGQATSTMGPGTRVPGQATSAQAQSLSVPRTAFAKTSGNGNNTTAWQPTLIVAIPASAVGGTYTGTVTHSVA
ncbi:hypothetical protein HW130_09595 [Streptomyces sp. PKU-EA00015]|uniref:hypothetical protein n=1 Tax=Streptomyces sp. PKU-EA00015 TaxID=2748326 RepID=UPI0015A317A0|nr:hypothetical protein [Streptomyces sp. PKU-EA00015]NWF26523.1 hypothetical protein [Streptomyces sp. PKU-EA00015]